MVERVLVTGAGGFIGRHVVGHLLRRKYKVYAITRSPASFYEEGLTWLTADLLSGCGVAEAVGASRATRLVHLAWDVSAGSYTSLENMDWVAASLRLFRMFLEEGGCGAVFAGSCAEYDWSHTTLDETATPLQPASLYGAAKMSLATAVQSVARQCSVPVGWARIFFVYGPFENRIRLVPSVVTALLDGREAVCSSGQQERDYMHVDDVAAAIVAILECEFSGSVNVASGVCLPVREIVSSIAQQMGVQGQIRFGALPDRLNDPPRLAAAVKTLHNAIGFNKARSLDQGLAQTIEWWRLQ